MNVKNALSVREFLKLGSNYRDIRLMRMSSKKITRNEGELHLLEQYFQLLVSTDYLRVEVYDFLVGQKTYKEISEQHDVNENYLRNIIYKEIQRVYEDITEDPFALVRYPDYFEGGPEEKAEQVDILTDRLEVLLSNHNLVVAEDLSEFMVMDISEKAESYREYNGEIDTDLFYETVDRLKYLSKPYLNTLFNRMDKRILGYVMYLLITRDRNLSERDQNNKQMIKETWFLPENR